MELGQQAPPPAALCYASEQKGDKRRWLSGDASLFPPAELPLACEGRDQERPWVKTYPEERTSPEHLWEGWKAFLQVFIVPMCGIQDCAGLGETVSEGTEGHTRAKE